jgi:hypothetical protein
MEGIAHEYIMAESGDGHHDDFGLRVISADASRARRACPWRRPHVDAVA